MFSHGFTLGKDCAAASRICKQLASEGIGMLRFDNLGLGDSEGDWGDGSFSHNCGHRAAARDMKLGREVRYCGALLGGATARAGPQMIGASGGEHRRAVPTRKVEHNDEDWWNGSSKM